MRVPSHVSTYPANVLGFELASEEQPVELQEGQSDLAVTVEWGGFDDLLGVGPDWPSSVELTEEEEMLFDYLMPSRKKKVLRCSDGTAYTDFLAASLKGTVLVIQSTRPSSRARWRSTRASTDPAVISMCLILSYDCFWVRFHGSSLDSGKASTKRDTYYGLSVRV